jgi:hypothetical protein
MRQRTVWGVVTPFRNNKYLWFAVNQVDDVEIWSKIIELINTDESLVCVYPVVANTNPGSQESSTLSTVFNTVTTVPNVA